MAEKSPLVSIIVATYNRSNILHYTIASVLKSTFSDWELLVIGDACTDDTEQVVAAFGDPRVRFINLEWNFGEQSGPNNEGFKHARGRYIAYLNHDDLWLPDHLEVALEAIEATEADLVFTLIDLVMPNGPNVLVGATLSGRYEPYASVPASCWLLRRELVKEIGPWPSYRESYIAPSQEWMYRAYRAGKDLRLVPKMTVVAITSGKRPGSYATREYHEHKHYCERMTNEPDFRERELTAIATAHFAGLAADERVGAHLLRALKNVVKKGVRRLGLRSSVVLYFLRYRRKGGFIHYLRRKRGLPELVPSRQR